MRNWKSFTEKIEVQEMEKSEIRSGDFLSDIEITVQLRSGSTELSYLQSILEAVEASIKTIVDTNLVTTETELKIVFKNGKKLTVLKTDLYIA